MSRLDLADTIYQMRLLTRAEIMECRTFDHARASYEMHPITRAELISELMQEPKLKSCSVAWGFGELKIDGIPVEPNPLLAQGVVRLVMGIRTGRVVTVPEAFTDEGKRR